MEKFDSKETVTLQTSEAEALAALVDAQLEEVVCGGWSRLSWERINPN